jgi:hypothetical protein
LGDAERRQKSKKVGKEKKQNAIGKRREKTEKCPTANNQRMHKT